MTLPESQWSKDNPRPVPRIHTPFKERVFRIIQKAVVKYEADRKENNKHR